MKKIPMMLFLFITSFFTLFTISCGQKSDIIISISKNSIELNLALEDQKEETIIINNSSKLENLRIDYINDANKYIDFSYKYANLTIEAKEVTSLAKLKISASNALFPEIIYVTVKNELPIIDPEYEFEINPRTIEINDRKNMYSSEIDVIVKDNEPGVMKNLKTESNWLFCEENIDCYSQIKIIPTWENNKIKITIWDQKEILKDYEALEITLWFENSINHDSLLFMFIFDNTAS